jgi:hypothetical protein
MEVGVYLRTGRITPYQRMQGFLLRQKLDLLEHEMEHQHDDPALMRALISDVIATDTRWKKSYRSPYEASNPDSK